MVAMVYKMGYIICQDKGIIFLEIFSHYSTWGLPSINLKLYHNINFEGIWERTENYANILINQEGRGCNILINCNG